MNGSTETIEIQVPSGVVKPEEIRWFIEQRQKGLQLNVEDLSTAERVAYGVSLFGRGARGVYRTFVVSPGDTNLFSITRTDVLTGVATFSTSLGYSRRVGEQELDQMLLNNSIRIAELSGHRALVVPIWDNPIAWPVNRSIPISLGNIATPDIGGLALDLPLTISGGWHAVNLARAARRGNNSVKGVLEVMKTQALPKAVQTVFTDQNFINQMREYLFDNKGEVRRVIPTGEITRTLQNEVEDELYAQGLAICGLGWSDTVVDPDWPKDIEVFNEAGLQALAAARKGEVDAQVLGLKAQFVADAIAGAVLKIGPALGVFGGDFSEKWARRESGQTRGGFVGRRPRRVVVGGNI